MKKVSYLTFLLIVFLAPSIWLEAGGLSVSPAGFIISNVTPGRTFNLYEKTGLKLSIYNNDEASHIFTLSVHKPLEVGRMEKGYLEIPDSNWCWFEKDEIRIGPHQVGYGNLFIKIPEEEEFYNQHWVATLGIMRKREKGIGLGLRINVRVQIETESRTDIKGKPDGIIAFKPSTLRFEDVFPGGAQKGDVTIYNNDSKTHTYRITPLLHSLKKEKQRTYLTKSYQMIPDPKWIILDKDSLKIKPKSSCVLSLKLNIPDRLEYHGKKWEELFLVEPEEGLPGFIRVQFQTDN